MSLVLGGGIGGLAASYYLSAGVGGGRAVSLLEGSQRLGGWIRTVRDPGTGVTFDKGPRTLRVKGEAAANTLTLLDRLGLADALLPITSAHPSASNRMIYVNNQLHLLPSNISSLFTRRPPFSAPLVSSLLKDLIAPSKKKLDDNIFDFVERRFGSELADYVISAMICGICAGDAKTISVKLLMPQLFDFEQAHRSVLIGLARDILNKKPTPGPKTAVEGLQARANSEKWNIFGFKGGMETFPNALAKAVKANGVDIRLGAEVRKLSFGPGSVSCQLSSGEVVKGERLISCLPANRLADLVREEHPLLSRELSDIPFVNVAVVNLAYKGKQLEKDAFGFLVPPSQNLPILGVIFDSCNFDAGDWTVLTVMMGGAWFDKYFAPTVSQDELLQLAASQVKDILHITAHPAAHHVSIMNGCIPQYVVGHSDRVKRITDYIAASQLPLSLVGSSYAGIGVNDVILSARTASKPQSPARERG